MWKTQHMLKFGRRCRSIHDCFRVVEQDVMRWKDTGQCVYVFGLLNWWSLTQLIKCCKWNLKLCNVSIFKKWGATFLNLIFSSVAAAGDLPIGLGTFRFCPACDYKFLTKVNRKSLCEIFLTPYEEKIIQLFRMARSNRWKSIFFVHFHVRRLME